MYMSDGCDLAIDKRRRLAHRFEPCSLLAVPSRRCFIVRQIRERPTYNFAEVSFESRASLAFWKSAATVRELVPHGRGNRALGAVLV
jgi:hypothetical protein